MVSSTISKGLLVQSLTLILLVFSNSSLALSLSSPSSNIDAANSHSRRSLNHPSRRSYSDSNSHSDSNLNSNSYFDSYSNSNSKRQDANLLDPNSYLASNFQNGSAPPGARPGDTDGQYVVVSDQNGTDAASQLPHCNTIFIGTADVTGGFDEGQGWDYLPQVLGFDLKRDITFDQGSTMPYYMDTGKDASKIKRVIIVQPGQPRDSWKYSNLVRNSLICAASNSSSGIDMSTIQIVAPSWLNSDDQSKNTTGTRVSTDLVWKGSTWAGLSRSIAPQNVQISMHEVMDGFTEHFFNKKLYPNLNSVQMVGHSLGSSVTQRYAMLRKPSSDDSNFRIWQGNAGSYVWPVSDRPNMTAVDTCPDYDTWTYGLNITDPKNIPPYGRQEVTDNKDAVLAHYRSFQTVVALGTNDYGPGDQHCQASFQGASHLERGNNFITALTSMPGGLPSNFQTSYIVSSHQDYVMIGDVASQDHMFVRDINTRNPPTNGPVTNTGASNNSTGGSGSKPDQKNGGAASVDPKSSLVTIGVLVLCSFLL